MLAKQWITMSGVLALALTACGSTGSTPGAVAGNMASGTSAPPALSIAVTNQAPSADEQKILDAVNSARAVARTCGSVSYVAAAPLTWNMALASAARQHSNDMAQNGYHEETAADPQAPHTGSDGSTPQQRITATGYIWQNSGENVAAGYAVGGANDVVAAWLQSPGHCENIMNPKFRDIGISYVINSNAKYRSFFTQDFGSR